MGELQRVGEIQMSSTWDTFARKVRDGSLTLDELKELLQFLREFDVANNGVLLKDMPRYMKQYYHFTTLDQLEFDVQNKGITQNALSWFIETLHSYDHAIDQVMMYTFNPGKEKHYWAKHTSYTNMLGTFKNGIWTRKLA